VKPALETLGELAGRRALRGSGAKSLHVSARQRSSRWAPKALALVLLALTPGAAAAQEPVTPTQSWSSLGGRTNGAGKDALVGDLGWPGISFAYTHGLSPTIDLGVRLSFNYGLEGTVGNSVLVGSATVPGLTVQGLLKLRLLERGKFSWALKFEPGPLFYFSPGFKVAGITQEGNVLVGFALPVRFAFGIAATSAINVALGVELPFWISFGGAVNTFAGRIPTPASLQLPVLVGAGLEYFITSNLLVSFKLFMGPTIFTGVGSAQLTVDSKVGVAWRF
jgi:hypothetical protein